MSFRSDRRPSGERPFKGGGRPYGGGRSQGEGRPYGGGRPSRGKPDRERRFDRDGASQGGSRSPRTDRFSGGDRPERSPRFNRDDRRDDRFDRRSGAGRGDRASGSERFPARGRFNRDERGDRNERFDRKDRFDRQDRFDRKDQFDRRSRQDRGDRYGNDRFTADRASGDRTPGDRFGRGGSRFSSSPERGRSFRHETRSGPRRGGWNREESRRAPEQDRVQGEELSHSLDQQPDDMLWGRHATQAALETGRPIHRVWCTAEVRSSPKFLQLLRDAKASGVLVEEVTWARLGQLTGGAVHQGIALQTASADTLDLPSLVEGCAALGEPPLLLALDGVTDPHNLGAVVRSAEALGAHGVVLPQRRSAGLTGSVAKVAAGALEHLPVARVVNLNRSLETLKDAGYRVVGLAGEGDVTLAEADLEGPLVVVTGSEGQGLSLLTRRHCDQLIRIPLRGVTPSLNASVATAMCLYEVARRGWMKDLKGQAPSPPIVRPRCTSSPMEDDGVAAPAESSDPVAESALTMEPPHPTPSSEDSQEIALERDPQLQDQIADEPIADKPISDDQTSGFPADPQAPFSTSVEL